MPILPTDRPTDRGKIAMLVGGREGTSKREEGEREKALLRRKEGRKEGRTESSLTQTTSVFVLAFEGYQSVFDLNERT